MKCGDTVAAGLTDLVPIPDPVAQMGSVLHFDEQFPTAATLD